MKYILNNHNIIIINKYRNFISTCLLIAISYMIYVNQSMTIITDLCVIPFVYFSFTTELPESLFFNKNSILGKNKWTSRIEYSVFIVFWLNITSPFLCGFLHKIIFLFMIFK